MHFCTHLFELRASPIAHVCEKPSHLEVNATQLGLNDQPLSTSTEHSYTIHEHSHLDSLLDSKSTFVVIAIEPQLPSRLMMQPHPVVPEPTSVLNPFELMSASQQ